MQLYFSAEQFNLAADILLKQGDPAGLLPRIIHRDLRFDFRELKQLKETLVSNWSAVSKELETCEDPKARRALEDRQAKLENMIERVTESCAIF